MKYEKIPLGGNPHYTRIWKIQEAESKDEYWRATQDEAIELADELGDILEINIKNKTVIYES